MSMAREVKGRELVSFQSLEEVVLILGHITYWVGRRRGRETVYIDLSTCVHGDPLVAFLRSLRKTFWDGE